LVYKLHTPEPTTAVAVSVYLYRHHCYKKQRPGYRPGSVGGDGRMGEWKDDEVEEEGGAVGGQGEREGRRNEWS